jgi:hypothetical protein
LVLAYPWFFNSAKGNLGNLASAGTVKLMELLGDASGNLHSEVGSTGLSDRWSSNDSHSNPIWSNPLAEVHISLVFLLEIDLWISGCSIFAKPSHGVGAVHITAKGRRMNVGKIAILPHTRILHWADGALDYGWTGEWTIITATGSVNRRAQLFDTFVERPKGRGSWAIEVGIGFDLELAAACTVSVIAREIAGYSHSRVSETIKDINIGTHGGWSLGDCLKHWVDQSWKNIMDLGQQKWQKSMVAIA